MAFILQGFALAGDYREPAYDKIPFESEKVTLSPEIRTALADDLSNLARSIDEKGPQAQDFRGKLMAVALKLNPEGKLPLVTNAMFKNGKSPAPTAEFSSVKTLSPKLLKIARDLCSAAAISEKKNNQTCAVYLFDLLGLVNADDEEMVFTVEKEKKNLKIEAVWGSVIGTGDNRGKSNGTATPAKPLPANAENRLQTKINGLVVLSNDGGEIGGKVMEIMVVGGIDPGDSSELNVTTTLGGSIAEDMKVSLEEAARLVRFRCPESKGVSASVSFDDKYSKKAGGSAGTAFTLALMSLIKRVTLDPAFAVTGDITVDGKVRKIGGIPYKIKGAILDRCKIIAIPKLNLEDWSDYVVISSWEDMLKAQVFSIETVDEAFDLASSSRKAELQAAIDQCAKLMETLKTDALLLKKPETLNSLKEILKTVPNHLTAQYLLDKGSGKSFDKLSREYCVSESVDALGPFWIIARKPEKPFLRYTFADESFSQAKKRFDELKPRLHRDAEGLYFDLLNFFEAVERYHSDFKSVPNLYDFNPDYGVFSKDSVQRSRAQDLEKQLKSVDDALIKLQYDKDYINKLIH